MTKKQDENGQVLNTERLFFKISYKQFLTLLGAVGILVVSAWQGATLWGNTTKRIETAQHTAEGACEKNDEQDGKINELEKTLSEIKGNTDAILEIMLERKGRRNR